uniref:Uncharacterized protein n=2 Tax=Setaria TaxID=4554 RepID=K3ZGE3_SETIT|nr:hypothetical protein SEVIR_3G224750v2 [Setaria viridis]
MEAVVVDRRGCRRSGAAGSHGGPAVRAGSRGERRLEGPGELLCIGSGLDARAPLPPASSLASTPALPPPAPGPACCLTPSRGRSSTSPFSL